MRKVHFRIAVEFALVGYVASRLVRDDSLPLAEAHRLIGCFVIAAGGIALGYRFAELVSSLGAGSGAAASTAVFAMTMALVVLLPGAAVVPAAALGALVLGSLYIGAEMAGVGEFG